MRRREGYLLIDNRASSLAGQGLFEAATYTCGHCNSVVVINPSRIRERGYCRGCDSRICDACVAIKSKTLECNPFESVVDKVLSEAEKTGSSSLLVQP